MSDIISDQYDLNESFLEMAKDFFELDSFFLRNCIQCQWLLIQLKVQTRNPTYEYLPLVVYSTETPISLCYFQQMKNRHQD